MEKNLENKIKTHLGLFGNLKIFSLGLSALALVGCGEYVNYAPVPSLSVSPTSGKAPLDVSFELYCEDPNGPEDVNGLKLKISGFKDREDIIITTGRRPIYSSLTFEKGKYGVSGSCIDYEGATGQTSTEINVD